MPTRLFAALFFILVFNRLLLAQPGAPDPAFGREGRVVTNIIPSNDQGFAVLLRPDGRIVSIGRAEVDSVDQFALVQQLPDGRPDEGFNYDGRTTPWLPGQKAFAYAGALYPDGRVVAAGFVGDFLGKDFALLRLLPDGSPDTSFQGTGWLTTDFAGGEDDAEAVLLQPDGKIIAAGFTSGDGIEADFALTRYLENGQLDPGFGDGGRVVRSFSPVSDVIFDAELQPDGHIVATGQTYDNNFASDFIVARFRPDGQIDSTFGTNGFAVSDVAFDDIGRAVALQADGKIVVAGISVVDFIPKIGAVRFLSDGSPDPTFGLNGQVLFEATPFGNFCTDALVQPDGGILLAGMAEGGATGDFRDFFVTRLLPDGTPDPAFGTGGTTVVSLSPFDDNAYRLALQPDGSILLVGVAQGDFALLRLSADGKLDQDFGAGGTQLTDVGRSHDGVATLLIQPDGKIVAGGSLTTNGIGPEHVQSAVVRYETDGSLDEQFGDLGIKVEQSSGGFSASAMAQKANGHLVVAGQVNHRAGLFSYTNDGAADDNFGVNGIVNTANPPGSVYFSMALDSAERIVAAGYSNSTPGGILQQFQANGLLDLDFGLNGMALQPLGILEWHRVKVDQSGKILALGNRSFNGPVEGVLMRFNSNGTPDVFFGENGMVDSTGLTSSSTATGDIAVLPDGKILIGGGGDDFRVVRLHPNGQRDQDFGVDGAVAYDSGQPFDHVQSMAVQADGSILLAGKSVGPGSSPDGNYFAIVRLSPDGSLDLGFGLNGMVHLRGLEARALSIQPADNTVVVAGKVDEGHDSDFLLVRLLAGPSVGLADRPDKRTILNIYPNPVAETLQLTYELTENQAISIDLFDESGRLVAALLQNAHRAAGPQQETVNLPATLPSGYYNVVVRTKTGSKALKIIKI